MCLGIGFEIRSHCADSETVLCWPPATVPTEGVAEPFVLAQAALWTSAQSLGSLVILELQLSF